MKNIVNFSGGKNSTAMLLRMIEMNMQIDEIIFADTRMEYPELYPYIKKVEKFIDRKIIYVYGDHWDKWFYGKITRGNYKGRRRGFPFLLNPCWYMREAKINPIYKYLKKYKDKIIHYLGYTIKEEERAINLIKKLRKLEKIEYRYPLIDWKWSDKECIEYLKKKEMLCILHIRFKRLGCWCCPKQSEKSLKTLYEFYPDLWQKLKKYEQDDPLKQLNCNIKLIKLEKKWKNNPRLL